MNTAEMTLEQAWQELQRVPSYIERWQQSASERIYTYRCEMCGKLFIGSVDDIQALMERPFAPCGDFTRDLVCVNE